MSESTIEQEARVNPSKPPLFSNQSKREMPTPKPPPTEGYPKKPPFWNVMNTPANLLQIKIAAAFTFGATALAFGLYFMLKPYHRESPERIAWEKDMKANKKMYFGDPQQRAAQYAVDRAKAQNKTVRQVLQEHFMSLDPSDKPGSAP